MDWVKLRHQISEKNGDGIKIFNRTYNNASINVDESDSTPIESESPKQAEANSKITWDDIMNDYEVSVS